jgi:hypothetical protein
VSYNAATSWRSWAMSVAMSALTTSRDLALLGGFVRLLEQRVQRLVFALLRSFFIFSPTQRRTTGRRREPCRSAA